jgi:hypothetical protein
MLKSHWLIAICVFILVLFLIFGIAWRIRNKSKLNDDTDQYKNPILWSKPKPATNADICYLYQFPSITQTVNDVTGTINIILPGLPTLNPAVLDPITDDKIKKVPKNLRCIDSDQILARKGKEVCENIKGKNLEAKNFCTRNTGSNAQPGEEQYLYYNDSDQKNGAGSCPNLRPCNGEVSLISINYNPKPDNNYAIGCITKITNDNVLLYPCADNNDDLPKQLFRLTRINYGEDPYASEAGQGSLVGQNGLFGQILERDTNFCLRRTETTGSNCIVFGTCHGGNYQGSSGIGGPRPGFNWLFIPSSDDGTQRLTYIGDINMYDFKPIYSGLTGYKGNTGTKAWTQWLVNNGAQTMAAPLCCTSYLYLVPSSVTGGDQVTANYFNISNFNLLRKLPACINGSPFELANCLGF